MRRYNLNEPEFTFDDDDPDGYHTGYDRIGPKVGGSKVGATHYLIRPGQSLCPYHYEYGEEEWLLVLGGTATVRTPEGNEDLREGDMVAFPEGPEGAHKVTNNTDADLRVLMWANIARSAAASTRTATRSCSTRPTSATTSSSSAHRTSTTGSARGRRSAPRAPSGARGAAARAGCPRRCPAPPAPPRTTAPRCHASRRLRAAAGAAPRSRGR